eukprot:gene10203-8117_t
MSSYVSLLHNVVDCPTSALGKLSLMKHSSFRDRLSLSVGDSFPEFLQGPLMPDMFRIIVMGHPCWPCLTYESDAMNYGEVLKEAEAVARLLTPLLGESEEPSDPLLPVTVAIMMDRSFELIISILEVLLAGGAYLPLDPDLPDKRLSLYLSGGGDVRAMLVNGSLAEKRGAHLLRMKDSGRECRLTAPSIIQYRRSALEAVDIIRSSGTSHMEPSGPVSSSSTVGPSAAAMVHPANPAEGEAVQQYLESRWSAPGTGPGPGPDPEFTFERISNNSFAVSISAPYPESRMASEIGTNVDNSKSGNWLEVSDLSEAASGYEHLSPPTSIIAHALPRLLRSQLSAELSETNLSESRDKVADLDAPGRKSGKIPKPPNVSMLDLLMSSQRSSIDGNVTSPDFEPSDKKAQAAAYVDFTSGSSGRPKGVAISHVALRDFVKHTGIHLGLAPGSVCILSASINFDAHVLQVLAPLSHGSRVVIPQQQGHLDPHYITNLMATECVTFWDTVPSLATAYLQEDPGLRACTALK